MVTSPLVASGLKWVIRFPQPHGLGLSPESVTAITLSDIDTLEPDHDCIVHEVFDPHTLFSALARAGPRRISFILMRNELRFVGERLLRSRQLFPDHPANDTILYPIYQQVERLEPVRPISRRDRTTTLFSDSDYEMVMRMFNLGPRMVEHGTVLTEEPEYDETAPLAEPPAYLFHLEGQSAVFLDASGRLSYVRTDDSIVSGPVNVLEAGHRLFIINPAARESIAHRILTARREQETDHVTGQTISRWRQELSDGIRRHAFTYNEMLRRIQELGSQRLTPAAIGQWARGDVLGPLDALDIRRIGQVIDSDWLLANWQRVGLELTIVRTGHRILGRRITWIIQQAAVGDYELSGQDEEFLRQIGITIGELQDAVTLLTIEDISREAKAVPVDQIGRVILV
jgi:hypothetical protein